MADPNDPANPGLFPPSPELVPIRRDEYSNYYFHYHGRRFPRYLLEPALQNASDVPQLPSVLPIDRQEMTVRDLDDRPLGPDLRCISASSVVQCCTIWYIFASNLTISDHFKHILTRLRGRWLLTWEATMENGDYSCTLSTTDVLFFCRIEDVAETLSHRFQSHHALVPSSPTEAANNHVRFEVYDFQRDGIRNAEGSVDIIHARFQNFHIKDWAKLLRDVAKRLKPGGLFMSGELDIYLEFPNGQPPDVYATNQFYSQVQGIMRERGYNPNIGVELEGMLRTISDSDGPLFTNIGSEVHKIPVGIDADNPIPVVREISALSMDCMISLGDSLRPFLLSQGSAAIEIDGLLDTYKHQLRRNRAQVSYRCTWAERRA
ncbi:Methyltransferase domain, partial [Rhizoctonia solani]